MTKQKLKLLVCLLAGLTTAVQADDLETIAKVTSSTVLIRTHLIHGFAEDNQANGRWKGSGFVIDRKTGLLVTNAHVAGHGIVKISVQFWDQDKTVEAKRLFVDTKHDIAVLKVDPEDIPLNSRSLLLDCDYSIQRGERVLALGHPKSHEFTSTLGVLSGEKSFGVDGEFYTTDLVTESGSSGGPIVSLDSGLVVGMATAGIDSSDLGLLTKSREICRIVEPLREGLDPSRPQLGFQQLVVDGEVSSRVGRVFDDQLNIQFGDEIVTVEGFKWDPKVDGDLEDQLRQITETSIEFLIDRDGILKRTEIPVKKRGSSHLRKWVYFNGLTIAESSHDDVGFRTGGTSDPVLVIQSIDRDQDDTVEVEFGVYDQVVSVGGIPVSRLEALLEILEHSYRETIPVVIRSWDRTSESIAFHFEHLFRIEEFKTWRDENA